LMSVVQGIIFVVFSSLILVFIFYYMSII